MAQDAHSPARSKNESEYRWSYTRFSPTIHSHPCKTPFELLPRPLCLWIHALQVVFWSVLDRTTGFRNLWMVVCPLGTTGNREGWRWLRGNPGTSQYGRGCRRYSVRSAEVYGNILWVNIMVSSWDGDLRWEFNGVGGITVEGRRGICEIQMEAGENVREVVSGLSYDLFLLSGLSFGGPVELYNFCSKKDSARYGSYLDIGQFDPRVCQTDVFNLWLDTSQPRFTFAAVSELHSLEMLVQKVVNLSWYWTKTKGIIQNNYWFKADSMQSGLFD